MLSDIDITQPGGVEEALNIIDEALNQTGLSQSGLGAFANRLQENASQLAVTSENITASYSGQMNTDFALESSRMATNQMLMEATFAVQTQALNLQNTMFLNLIR
jgi:flagellin